MIGQHVTSTSHHYTTLHLHILGKVRASIWKLAETKGRKLRVCGRTHRWQELMCGTRKAPHTRKARENRHGLCGKNFISPLG